MDKMAFYTLILYYWYIFNILMIIVVYADFCTMLNDTNSEEIWSKYKSKYNKHYQGDVDGYRRLIWVRNCHIIKKHNEKACNFTLSSNHLADMSWRRYHNNMIKLLRNKETEDSLNMEIVGNIHIDYENVPQNIDWRDKGFKTSSINQKNCGSCYAFCISHAIEAQVFRKTNILEPLSAQQIIDCSSQIGNHGCNGGSLRNTLKYLDKSQGLMTAKDYIYVAKQMLCEFDKKKVLVNVTSWGILPARSEQTVEAVVGTIGPVAASINASPHTFQLYKSGIYDDPTCSSSIVNHAMLIVGYTNDYWILKNWWSDQWGEQGYMRLKKNINQCGISNYVAYILV